MTSPAVLATASWVRLLSITHAYQAAEIGGDREEAERLRREAHDVLDGNLDQRAAAAYALRQVIEGG